jgi:predicted nucleotidyltransferase
MRRALPGKHRYTRCADASLLGGEGGELRVENSELKAILDELKQRLSNLYGDRLAEMILYGSQARGDAEEGSDIDILVVLKGEVNACKEIDRTIDIVANISLTHDTVVSCVFMDEEYYSHRNPPLLMNIRREGVRL